MNKWIWMNEWIHLLTKTLDTRKAQDPTISWFPVQWKQYISPPHIHNRKYTPKRRKKIPKWHSNVEYLLSIKLWGTILHCKFPRSATGRVTCASFKSIRQCSIGWQQDMCAVLHVPSYCDFDRTVSPTVEQMAKILWNTLLAITGWSIIISNLVGYL